MTKIRLVTNGIGAVAGILLFSLMVLTVIDVVKRTVTDSGLTGAVEIVEVAIVAIVFLGMGIAESSNTHIRTPILVDVVAKNVSSKAAQAMRMLGLAAALFIVGWLFYETVQTGWAALEERSYRYGILRVPDWPAKMAIPLGLAVFFLALVARAVKVARGGPTGHLDADLPDDQRLVE